MLHLVFHLGPERYALEARNIVELIPAVPTRPLMGAPAGVVGLIDFRGEMVCVVDLCQLVLQRPAQKLYSTRIVVVRLEGEVSKLGLLAEEVTQTRHWNPAAFQPPGVEMKARFLGPVVTDGAGMVQKVQPAELLTEELKAALRKRPQE